MNKCLKITVQGDIPDGFMRSVVQKEANKLSVEGTAQRVQQGEKLFKIVACGPKDAVDNFLDALYKGAAKIGLDYIEVEPFFKEKDYRGIFRVIE